MERGKLKLTVIILLALLNVFLLGLVLSQNLQSQTYEQDGRAQALVYLNDRGIQVEEDVIPWESVFQDAKADPRKLLFEASQVPQDGTVSSWEILSMRQPETLVVDFVRGLSYLSETCSHIESIAEGYVNTGGGDRVVLTPMWRVSTDSGIYQLNCTTGEVTKQE